MPVSLVATRFHLVEGMCKLKTRTHMGKLAAHLSCGDKIFIVSIKQVENGHPKKD